MGCTIVTPYIFSVIDGCMPIPSSYLKIFYGIHLQQVTLCLQFKFFIYVNQTPYVGWQGRGFLSLRPIATVEAAIADGFGYVGYLYVVRVIEVGYGAGYLQDAAVGTG